MPGVDAAQRRLVLLELLERVGPLPEGRRGEDGHAHREGRREHQRLRALRPLAHRPHQSPGDEAEKAAAGEGQDDAGDGQEQRHAAHSNRTHHGNPRRAMKAAARGTVMARYSAR